MTMSLAPFQVRCPACEAEYPVDPERVPPDGVHAVCAACMRTFAVEPPPASFDAEIDLESEPAIEEGSAVPGVEAEPEIEAVPEPEVQREPEVRGEPEIESEPEIHEAPEIRSEPPVEVEPPVDVEPPVEVEPEVEVEPPVESETEDAPAAPGPAAEGPTEAAEAGTVEDLRDIVGDTDEPEEAGQSAGSAALSRGAARFGRRDPHERAQRLARVLVSDIIAYYPKKHAEAVERGTVKEEFEDEVRKSRKEYVDQVGEEIADSTPYFTEALNEVLARGRQIY